MEQENETEKSVPVWIDKVNRIVSFRKVNGFEQLNFSDRNEMLIYVVEIGLSGYRIQ